MSNKYGPQTPEIEALIARAETLTENEVESLDAAWDAAWNAAWDAARDAAWDATAALVVRHLIGQHGVTQQHYDLLTGPWRTVIGPIHPDDIDMREARV